MCLCTLVQMTNAICMNDFIHHRMQWRIKSFVQINVEFIQMTAFVYIYSIIYVYNDVIVNIDNAVGIYKSYVIFGVRFQRREVHKRANLHEN